MSVFDQSFHKTSGCLGSGCGQSRNYARGNDSNNNIRGSNKQQLTGKDQQTKEEIESMLSQAFNTLTFEERQVQQEQLHGVANEIAEEATLIDTSLQELKNYLNQTKVGRVYETAERQGPAYVYARSFRVSFLRADRYNAKAAADRMLRFFDEKQKLFGMEKLTKDITIDDLDEDDIAAVKAGSMQWAGKDRSNRPILFAVPGLRKFKELRNELRARYFIMMEGAKSPEAQLRGYVALTYSVGDCKDSRQGKGFLEHSRLAETMPIFVGAFHVVCDDISQYLIGRAVIAIMPAELRARVRLHLGTHLECQYHLSTYGIPTVLLPLSPETNTIDMAPHLRWCESYSSNNTYGGGTKDDPSPMLVPHLSSAAIITEPNPNDVVSAGSTKSDNFGNDRLRRLVKEHAEAYTAGSYDDKRYIVDNVIREIHDMGGRFLQKNKGAQTWNEIPSSKVRLKITQRFRNYNRRRESAWQQDQEGILIAGNPLPNDVIFGRNTQRNRGTALLHHLIKERSAEYEATNRRTKVAVVDAIIEQIQREGGRFLQPSKADLRRYVELSSTDSIRDRLSSYFRNYRRKASS